MVTKPDNATGPGAHGSSERPAGLSEATIDQICEFLDHAPPQLQAWAEARAKAVRSGEDEALNLLVVPQAETGVVTPDPRAALAELGEDDGPTIVTPQDRPARPHPREGAKVSSGVKAIIATVVAVALVIGIWMIGRTPEPSNTDMGQGAEQMADTQGRILELEKEKQDNPDNLDLSLELGLLYFNRGDLDNAQVNWEYVTAQDPQNIQAWYNLGFLYVSLDPPDNDKAKTAWEHVIEIDPRSPLAQTVQNHMGALLTEPSPSGDG
ncbi:MAG: tetratricopeptide repeat protein [Actinomycetaceae bacterium]|nr:tetratricopeptide repeat protein [Actinomycetaceae bacterium]